MKVKVKTGPAAEPITLAEAKEFLCFDTSIGTASDAKITSMIKASREAAESFLNQTIPIQTLQLALDSYPPSQIDIPKGPLVSLDAITLYAADGTTSSDTTTSYIVDTFGSSLVRKDSAISPVVTLQEANGFIVEYKAGFSSIPDEIKQAMYLYIKGQFESIPPQEFMPAFHRLLWPYREASI